MKNKSITLITTLSLASVFAFKFLYEPALQEGEPDNSRHVGRKPELTPGEVRTDSPGEFVETHSPIEDSDTYQESSCEEVDRDELAYLAPEEFAVFESAHYFGADVRNYIGVDQATVEANVEQGDTAAMVVLARMYVVAARSDGDVNARLTDYERSLNQLIDTSNAQDEESILLSKASELYWDAAIHGRVLALLSYGLTLETQGKDAVDLGWIAQEEFDQLTELEKKELTPSSAYISLLERLAPEALDWATREKIPATEVSESGVLNDTVDVLEQEYYDSIFRMNLELPEAITSEFPVYLELTEIDCSA